MKGGVCFFMKTITKKKSRTVTAKTGEEFDREFNSISDELETGFELVWDPTPMCVHFIYDEQMKIPETVAEELALRGEHYFCKDCPYLQRGKNKREKSHGCKYAPYGTVQEFSPACEFFLKKLITGEVKAVEG